MKTQSKKKTKMPSFSQKKENFPFFFVLPKFFKKLASDQTVLDN